MRTLSKFRKSASACLRKLVPAPLFVALSATVLAADDADLAKQLSNPLASLISVPFQFNYDSGYGSADGNQTTLNIQPVIPFSLSDNLNLITRTIIPYKWQNDVSGLSGRNQGFGDTTVSLWLSPTRSSFTWGAGPIFYLPTSSDRDLGVGEWGGGITGVVLVQEGPWTIGGLANHIWSFESSDINSTYVQPFLAYTTPNAWTYTVNSESTYDWNAEEWTAPVNLMVSKLVKFGEQRVSLQGGARYYLASPETGPDGWGARLSMTFVFPR
ncbi:transporter [Ruegeria sp. Ofav3-42]|uniref:transporter n=1 Tax=Ruegeria sp. Ofav3-42 TaxID=2917759 RepID=UPI001EF63605|nr:transporter [Ruegeria sp. Ofav3-42]MCG7521786.1 transporter [Ruegeria sp. Ofav3-42]